MHNDAQLRITFICEKSNGPIKREMLNFTFDHYYFNQARTQSGLEHDL